MSVLQHYAELITDPAHTLVEFTFVLLDYLVISVVANRLKAHFHRDLDEEHSLLDAEHGITPDMHEHPQITLHEDGTGWVGNVRVIEATGG